jgi:DNA-binding ferritin-like protein
MEVTENISGTTDTNTYITSALKCLLADEYILMNRTSSCLLDAASPFVNIKNNIFQGIYDDLKRSSEQVAIALKKKTENIAITINDIVSNTSIKKKDINWRSKVAVLETLVADNQVVISRLDEVITDLTIYKETESLTIFNQIRQTHRRICVKLRLFIKKLLHSKASNL